MKKKAVIEHMPKKENVAVEGTEISILTHKHNDYISPTDMAKYKNTEIPGIAFIDDND